MTACTHCLVRSLQARFCANDCGNLRCLVKSADVRQLDLQKIGRARFQHGQRVLGRTDALLSGDRYTHGATKLRQTLEIAASQWLLRVGEVKLAQGR
jgi:hypothetical protein